MNVINAEEAAHHLGLSAVRVRQLAAEGAIPAFKIGRSWAFESSELEGLPARPRLAGRPIAPAIAWAVLWLRDGRNIGELEPYAASRARKYAERDLADLWPRLGRRAQIQEMFVHPSRLDGLGRDARLVPAGVSAADHHDVGLIVSDEVEAYVRHGDVNDVIDEHHLIVPPGAPNVILRVVGDPIWPFEDHEQIAPRSVVAVDLLERSRGADRLRAAALELDA